MPSAEPGLCQKWAFAVIYCTLLFAVGVYTGVASSLTSGNSLWLIGCVGYILQSFISVWMFHQWSIQGKPTKSGKRRRDYHLRFMDYFSFSLMQADFISDVDVLTIYASLYSKEQNSDEFNVQNIDMGGFFYGALTFICLSRVVFAIAAGFMENQKVRKVFGIASATTILPFGRNKSPPAGSNSQIKGKLGQNSGTELSPKSDDLGDKPTKMAIQVTAPDNDDANAGGSGAAAGDIDDGKDEDGLDIPSEAQLEASSLASVGREKSIISDFCKSPEQEATICANTKGCGTCAIACIVGTDVLPLLENKAAIKKRQRGDLEPFSALVQFGSAIVESFPVLILEAAFLMRTAVGQDERGRSGDPILTPIEYSRIVISLVLSIINIGNQFDTLDMISPDIMDSAKKSGLKSGECHTPYFVRLIWRVVHVTALVCLNALLFAVCGFVWLFLHVLICILFLLCANCLGENKGTLDAIKQTLFMFPFAIEGLAWKMDWFSWHLFRNIFMMIVIAVYAFLPFGCPECPGKEYRMAKENDAVVIFMLVGFVCFLGDLFLFCCCQTERACKFHNWHDSD